MALVLQKELDKIVLMEELRFVLMGNGVLAKECAMRAMNNNVLTAEPRPAFMIMTDGNGANANVMKN